MKYWLLPFALQFIFCQFPPTSNIYLRNSTSTTQLVTNGSISSQFYQFETELDCSMPKLYVYPDEDHSDYEIISSGIIIDSVYGKWKSIQSNVQCQETDCTVVVNDLCEGDGKNQINWIIIEANRQELEYLVNCAPQYFYKPFEWGLFILILFCTIAITLASLYSKAWSYGGAGMDINLWFIGAFNGLLIVGLIASYLLPSVVAVVLKVVGSIAGTFGVTVCVSQSLWLLKSRRLSYKWFWFVRIIDVTSFAVGVILTAIFWLTNGQWIVNDILAVSLIVALIKLLKIRSLFIAVVLLSTLLILEIVFGLIIHFQMQTSYNNFIINTFQSPIVVVLPSITHQLYRKCAWIPVTSILCPGLFLSYLRRFDLARGTFLYLLIGYISFYFGSVLWMAIDLSTVHSLPLAIISEPVTIIIVIIASCRRNQFKTLWKGHFYDSQLPNITEELLPARETQIIEASGFRDLTDNIKIENDRSSFEHSIE